MYNSQQFVIPNTRSVSISQFQSKDPSTTKSSSCLKGLLNEIETGICPTGICVIWAFPQGSFQELSRGYPIALLYPFSSAQRLSLESISQCPEVIQQLCYTLLAVPSDCPMRAFVSAYQKKLGNLCPFSLKHHVYNSVYYKLKAQRKILKTFSTPLLTKIYPTTLHTINQSQSHVTSV